MDSVEKIAKNIIPDEAVDLGFEEKVRVNWESLRNEITEALLKERERADALEKELKEAEKLLEEQECVHNTLQMQRLRERTRDYFRRGR